MDVPPRLRTPLSCWHESAASARTDPVWAIAPDRLLLGIVTPAAGAHGVLVRFDALTGDGAVRIAELLARENAPTESAPLDAAQVDQLFAEFEAPEPAPAVPDDDTNPRAPDAALSSAELPPRARVSVEATPAHELPPELRADEPDPFADPEASQSDWQVRTPPWSPAPPLAAVASLSDPNITPPFTPRPPGMPPLPRDARATDDAWVPPPPKRPG